MPFPAIPNRVTCPQCDNPFIVQVRMIIDVGAEPELKEQFLTGEVNYAKCPECGGGGLISTPLVYHDPSKELLVSYIPQELGLPAEEQEKLVGQLIQTIMDSLPTEERKGYFLQPKTALTLESLYDTILEADGISKEYLEAHRARLALVNQLLAVVDDDDALDKMVEENREKLNYEFFLILSNAIEGQEAGNGDEAETLKKLREKLLDRVNPTMPSAAPPSASHDELIEMLENAEPGEAWRHTIALNRGRLDYAFFQALTAKIDAARASDDAETADKLSDLRARILAELDAINQIAHEAEDRASLLILNLSEAVDLEAAVREEIEQVDQVFMAVLARYRALAERQGDAERAEKLDALVKAVRKVLEERLPPDLRLITGLLARDYPEETDALLEENRGLLTDDLLKTYDEYVAALEGGGPEETEKLKKVREQIAAKMAILRP